mgnify:CR=1 FL=1
MARDTGFPDEDARTDFERSRRRANIARLASWVRGQPGDVTEVLPYDEVVSALGLLGCVAVAVLLPWQSVVTGAVVRRNLTGYPPTYALAKLFMTTIDVQLVTVSH